MRFSFEYGFIQKQVECYMIKRGLGFLPVIQNIMHVLTDKMGYDGVNMIQNNGRAAGQLISHLHFHIIPRKTGDGFAHWQGQGYTEGEEAITAAQMREELSN